ncbi:MAG TPA: prepilin-type N-terminal cleavage/methylation domain-containing protein [Candidatus Saccharimonadales bacterium]|nr:prepilin-type N-terminal cleavage/methylation domain-containing protein [Candidatus Saccharimonadales bacterium]
MRRQHRFIAESPAFSGQRGFTVIEMMIVLAVAGLILLVVLLAVPALERSSHNNQRRQDIQQILAAVSHYELNNGGNMPSSDAPLSAGDLSRLTYYTPLGTHNPTYLTATSASDASCQPPTTPRPLIVFCIAGDWKDTPTEAPHSVTPDLDTVYIYNHQVCDANNPGQSTSSGAGYNSVVALYAIQTGANSTAVKCQQL